MSDTATAVEASDAADFPEETATTAYAMSGAEDSTSSDFLSANTNLILPATSTISAASFVAKLD